MRETWVRSLGWEDPLEKGKATHSSILAWRIPGTTVHGVAKSRTQLSDSLSIRVLKTNSWVWARTLQGRGQARPRPCREPGPRCPRHRGWGLRPGPRQVGLDARHKPCHLPALPPGHSLPLWALRVPGEPPHQKKTLASWTKGGLPLSDRNSHSSVDFWSQMEPERGTR